MDKQISTQEKELQNQSNSSSNQLIGLSQGDKLPVNALDIFHSKNSSLVKAISNGNIKEVKAVMKLLIIDTVQYLTISKTMSAPQVEMTVDLICAHEYFMLHKLDYFQLCFSRAKQGEYGKVFGGVDGQVIFEWLWSFDKEYRLEIEARQLNTKIRIEKDVLPTDPKLIEDPRNKPVPMPDNVKELIKSIGSKKEPEQKKEVVRTKAQILVDGFISHFQEHHTAEHGGIRFIVYRGKTLDFKNYIDARMMDYETEQRDLAGAIFLDQDIAATRSKKGMYESVYECMDFEDTVYKFFIPHEEAKDVGIRLDDQVNAIDIIDWLLIN